MYGGCQASSCWLRVQWGCCKVQHVHLCMSQCVLHIVHMYSSIVFLLILFEWKCHWICIIRAHCLTQLLHCQCFCVYVCVLFTTVSCAKTAEPIEMPFGIWSHSGSKEPCIKVGTLIPQGKLQFFGGDISQPIVKYMKYLVCPLSGTTWVSRYQKGKIILYDTHTP